MGSIPKLSTPSKSMAGAAGNRKRGNSATPDVRPAKRQFIGQSSQAPSSPEEGELEDGEEQQREQQLEQQEQQQVRHRKFQTKVPFPFKTASTSASIPDTNNSNARSTLSRSPSSPPPSQMTKHRLPAKPQASNPSPRRGMDRYVPPYRDEKEWGRGHHARYDYYPRREYDSWRPEYEDGPARANYNYRPSSRSRSRSRSKSKSREQLRSHSLSQPQSPRPHSPLPSRPPPPELPPPPIPPSTAQLSQKRDSDRLSLLKLHVQLPSTPLPPPPPSIPKRLEQPTQLQPSASTPTPAPSLPPPPPRSKKPRRPPIERTDSADHKAYGHTFTGCGRIDDYDIATKVGEGTFGEVHKAIHRPTSTQVALKRILMHNEKEGMPITAIREIKILKKMNHLNIVQLKAVIVQRSSTGATTFHMVFPYMDHDLAGLLENERVQLTPSQIKLYMKQLLEGTAYMHANNIIHRDMKAANLLISNTGLLQIADFGLARPFDPEAAHVAPRNGEASSLAPRYTNCVVTRWYRPPELFLGARRYGGEIDMWGIGCVLGEIFIRRPILMGSSDANQLDLIWQLCGSPSGETWPDYDSLPGLDGVKRWNRYDRQIKTKFHAIGPETVDLLDKLLTLDPSRRITAIEALDHEWFWSDPMPADPKTLPKYESSHEIDKRSKRHIPGLIPGPGMAPRPGAGAAIGPNVPGAHPPPPPHHNLPPPMYNPHAHNQKSNAPISSLPPPPHGQGHNFPLPLAPFGGPGVPPPPIAGPGGPVPPPYAGPGPMSYPAPHHYPQPPPAYVPPPPNWRPPTNWFNPPIHPPHHPNQPYLMGMPPPPIGPGAMPGHGGMGMAYPPYGQQQQHHGQRRHHNYNHHHNRHNSHNNSYNSNISRPSIWPPPGTHGLPPKPKVDLPALPDSGRGGGGGNNGARGDNNNGDRNCNKDHKRDDNNHVGQGSEHKDGSYPFNSDSGSVSGAPRDDSTSISTLPYD